MAIRENLSKSSEARDILIADIVLIFAFTSVFAFGLGGIFTLFASPQKDIANFIYYLPMAAVAATLSFVLHELMHKFVAQRYGAIAAFRASRGGLLITLATGAIGFLLGIPGATMIYVHNLTKREHGIVSLAGPLTNFTVFAVFLALLFIAPPNGYIANLIFFVMFVSILLAFFNMLPIYPLDGSKVLAWDKRVYVATMGVIFVLMYIFAHIPLTDIFIWIIIALYFSMFYRHIL